MQYEITNNLNTPVSFILYADKDGHKHLFELKPLEQKTVSQTTYQLLKKNAAFLRSVELKYVSASPL